MTPDLNHDLNSASLTPSAAFPHAWRYQKIMQQRAAQLREICDQLDPYRPLSPEMQQQLQQFGINDFSDPFQITNQLLLLLEDTLTELHNLA